MGRSFKKGIPMTHRAFPIFLTVALGFGLIAQQARATEEVKKIKIPYKTLVSLDSEKNVRGQIMFFKPDGKAVGSLDKKGDAFDLPDAGEYTMKIYSFQKDEYEFHAQFMIRNGSGIYNIDLVAYNPSINPFATKKVKAVLVKQTPASAPAVLIKNTPNATDLMLEFPAR
jgi:hypothetical protein